MTKKDKELLLQDLCARLPYGVKCQFEDRLLIVDGEANPYYDYVISERHIELFRNHKDFYIKPYLRPMSSMTEEEKKEVSHLLPKDWSVEIDKLNNFYFDMSPSIFMEIDVFLNIIAWLNAHHFDYRGLIPKDLALEAPDGMYNQNLQNMAYKYFPSEFSSYEDYVKYLKEINLAIEVTEEKKIIRIKNKIMKSWTATDTGKVEEIKVALLQLEKEHSISFSEEMEWLDNLKYRE